MEEAEAKKVKFFKNQLQSYLVQNETRKSYEDKLQLINRSMELHSTQFGSVHYNSVESDTKLANWITKKAEYEKELENLDYITQRVEKILSYMQAWMAKDLIKIYTGKTNYQRISDDIGYPVTSVKKMFDMNILYAIHEYENN